MLLKLDLNVEQASYCHSSLFCSVLYLVTNKIILIDPQRVILGLMVGLPQNQRENHTALYIHRSSCWSPAKTWKITSKSSQTWTSCALS